MKEIKQEELYRIRDEIYLNTAIYDDTQTINTHINIIKLAIKEKSYFCKSYMIGGSLYAIYLKTKL